MVIPSFHRQRTLIVGWFSVCLHGDRDTEKIIAVAAVLCRRQSRVRGRLARERLRCHSAAAKEYSLLSSSRPDKCNPFAQRYFDVAAWCGFAAGAPDPVCVVLSSRAWSKRMMRVGSGGYDVSLAGSKCQITCKRLHNRCLPGAAIIVGTSDGKRLSAAHEPTSLRLGSDFGSGLRSPNWSQKQTLTGGPVHWRKADVTRRPIASSQMRAEYEAWPKGEVGCALISRQSLFPGTKIKSFLSR